VEEDVDELVTVVMLELCSIVLVRLVVTELAAFTWTGGAMAVRVFGGKERVLLLRSASKWKN